MAPVRARRLLDAGRTGKPPYSPSFDPRTNTIVFHAGRERTALLQASLSSDGAVDEISTVREDGSRSYHAQVSPDGERLAYDSDVDGTRGVYIAQPRRLFAEARERNGLRVGADLVTRRAVRGLCARGARTAARVERLDGARADRRAAAHTRHTASGSPGARRGSLTAGGSRTASRIASSCATSRRGVSRAYPHARARAGWYARRPCLPTDNASCSRCTGTAHGCSTCGPARPTRLLADASAEEFAWSPDGRRVAYHSVPRRRMGHLDAGHGAGAVATGGRRQCCGSASPAMRGSEASMRRNSRAESSSAPLKSTSGTS